MQHSSRRILVWTLVVALIVLMLLATQFPPFTDEVQWGESAAYSVLLLAAGGTYELWRWMKTRTRTYRVALGVGLLGLLLLGWVSGAVGIIGSENNPANLMYWAVPAALLIGSLLARLRPRGLAYTLFAVALVQLSVPVIALLAWPAKASWGGAGVIGVFVLNAFFAALFAVSALLFLRASATSRSETETATAEGD